MSVKDKIWVTSTFVAYLRQNSGVTMGTELSRSLKTPWLNREMLGLGNGGEEVTPSLTELFFTKKDAQVGVLRFQPPPS